jgi:hypothetical protein
MLGHYEQASFILEVNKPCVAEYFALVSVTSSATVPSLIKMFFLGIGKEVFTTEA